MIVMIVLSVTVLYSVRNSLLRNESTNLQSLVERTKNDLQYTNGTWNTTKYNADPYTPHPGGSGGFNGSLYVITEDGYVIERTQPINGILDSADFKHLITFGAPQTISIITNDQWRVLSGPIVNKQGVIVGVVMVAYFNPEPQQLSEIDKQLSRDLSYITTSLTVSDDKIDVSKIDIRNINYDTSFEVVNRFNRVLLNTGRVPTYIDPSYVEQEIAKPEGQVYVTDAVTNKSYILYRANLTDNSGRTVGTIIAGRPIDYINTVMQEAFLPAALASIAAIVAVAFFVFRYGKALGNDQDIIEETQKHAVPDTISFDAKNSTIAINDTVVQVPYATNQYELADAVFSQPTKRWELDELLEKFGDTEDFGNWRKVYDATLALNKRTGLKIVVYKDKTFRFNPELVSHLKK